MRYLKFFSANRLSLLMTKPSPLKWFFFNTWLELSNLSVYYSTFPEETLDGGVASAECVLERLSELATSQHVHDEVERAAGVSEHRYYIYDALYGTVLGRVVGNKDPKI